MQNKLTLLFTFLMFILFLRERQGQSESGGGAEREGDTESEADSRFRAASTEPNMELKLTDHKIMTWAELRHLTNWATQVPLWAIFVKYIVEV